MMGSHDRTMEAAVLVAPGEMQVVQVPLPVPAAGELRIRLEGCGVCASNLEPWAGAPWMEYPRAPGELGHEGWGVIDAIGPQVDPAMLGKRVTTLSGKSYAQHDLAHADAVLALPRVLDGRPFPGEPLSCAVSIFRRSDIRPGQMVAIVGIGFLGAILSRLVTDAGAQVIAISRRDFSRALAQFYGARETIPMDDQWQIVERVKALTSGRLCDRVIEAVGKQWPLDLAGELVTAGGKLIVAGYHQDGPRQVNMQMWNWKGIDVINAHERDRAVQMNSLREALALVESGRLDTAPLYTHVYPLKRLGEALDATRDKPDGFVKALVML